MNTIQKKIKLILSQLLIIGMAIICVTSCSKNDDLEDGETFDINRLSEYILYLRRDDANAKNSIRIYDFREGNTAFLYASGGNFGAQTSYTIVENNTIKIGNNVEATVDQQGNVISMTYTHPINPSIIQEYKHFTLIKKSATNQFAGKSFTGNYLYSSDNTLAGAPVTYQFDSNGNLLTGLMTINGAVRNPNVHLIGNVAHFYSATKNAVTDYESMVIRNGKLEVSYKANDTDLYLYGTFE